MTTTKNRLITLFLVIALVFTGCITSINYSYADTTTISFTQSSVKTNGTYISNFVINKASLKALGIDGYNGIFSASGAKAFNKTGKAKATALSNSKQTARLVFYYAVFKNQAKTNLQKLRLQNALTYVTEGSKNLSKAAVTRSKDMVNASKNFPIPSYYHFKAVRYKSTKKINKKYPYFVAYTYSKETFKVGLTYKNEKCNKAITQHGGKPVLLEYLTDDSVKSKEAAMSLLKKYDVDALLIPGGSGVGPSWYGETARTRYSDGNPLVPPEGDVIRDPTDFYYLQAALEMDMPIIAICRGHEMFNVVLGGTMFQSIKEEFGITEDHTKCIHKINVVSGTLLADIIGAGTHSIYSNHIQGVARLGKPVTVNARSNQGVVEAMNVKNKTFALSLQFHPEYENEENPSMSRLNSIESYKIFTRFLTEAGKYQKSRKNIVAPAE